MIEAVFFLKWGYGFPDLPRRLPYLLITVSWRSFQSLRPLLLGTSLIAALIPLLPFLSFFLFPCKTMHDWRNIGKFPIPPPPSLLLLLLFRLPAYLPALPLSPPSSKRIDCSLTCSLARLLNNYLLARSLASSLVCRTTNCLLACWNTDCSLAARTTTDCLLGFCYNDRLLALALLAWKTQEADPPAHSRKRNKWVLGGGLVFAWIWSKKTGKQHS